MHNFIYQYLLKNNYSTVSVCPAQCDAAVNAKKEFLSAHYQKSWVQLNVRLIMEGWKSRVANVCISKPSAMTTHTINACLSCSRVASRSAVTRASILYWQTHAG